MKLLVGNYDDGRMEFNLEFSSLLSHNNLMSAKQLWEREGESVKKQRRERGTERILLDNPGGEPVETFIKRYLPLSAKERLKRLISGHPQHSDGAFHEWKAILAFHEKNLPTMYPIAVGKAAKGTCLLTLGIAECVRASELLSAFNEVRHNRKAIIVRKRNLVARIARAAAIMHKSGMAHQDFYLVHIFVRPDERDKIFIIDLQRVVMQSPLDRRWIVKDIGQLLYSAWRLTSAADKMYFWKNYASPAQRRDHKLIRDIIAKARKIQAKDKSFRSA